MSSVSGARSVVCGSDELYDCDPCKSEGRHKDAEYHCQQCQKFLCVQCKGHHKKFNISRDHNVVRVTSSRGSRSVLGASDEINNCNPCETEGRIREANYYCENCKAYFLQLMLKPPQEI